MVIGTKLENRYIPTILRPFVMDALSTILRLLEEELEAASWLIEARSIMELVELYNEGW